MGSNTKKEATFHKIDAGRSFPPYKIFIIPGNNTCRLVPTRSFCRPEKRRMGFTSTFSLQPSPWRICNQLHFHRFSIQGQKKQAFLHWLVPTRHWHLSDTPRVGHSNVALAKKKAIMVPRNLMSVTEKTPPFVSFGQLCASWPEPDISTSA